MVTCLGDADDDDEKNGDGGCIFDGEDVKGSNPQQDLHSRPPPVPQRFGRRRANYYTMRAKMERFDNFRVISIIVSGRT